MKVGHRCPKCEIHLILGHFWSNEGPFTKNHIMTYISVNVGHSNLNFDMEVNVIYRCHMSPAKLKYLFKGKNVPPFTGQCIENGV